MKSRIGLYMLAIMPPKTLGTLIDEERKQFAQTYGFVAALKPPVHATVYENFHSSEEIEHRFSSLKNRMKKQAPFLMSLCNFSFFDNPAMGHPVVYLAVEENRVLKTLQKKVLQEVNRVRQEKSLLTSYTPHFTIGYRDVTWNAFPDIKMEYSRKSFEGSFLCEAIYLWKHDGQNWQIHDTFNFEGTENTSYDQLELF